jgi:hypothetical protein
MNATDTATRQPHDAHPPWCTVETDFHESDAGIWHRGRARTVAGYDERPVTVEVCAQWWNPIPERRRLPYNSPDSIRPMVELSRSSGNELEVTPAEARQLAAALIAVADELDPPAAPGQDG